MLLFTRGKQLAPDCAEAQAGLVKCRKTILNKISSEKIYFFNGSKLFIDHLRRQGRNAVDEFLSGEELSFKAVSSLAAIKKKLQLENLNQNKKQQKMKTTNKRIEAEKIFLKNLRKSINPIKGFEHDHVR